MGFCRAGEFAREFSLVTKGHEDGAFTPGLLNDLRGLVDVFGRVDVRLDGDTSLVIVAIEDLWHAGGCDYDMYIMDA